MSRRTVLAALVRHECEVLRNTGTQMACLDQGRRSDRDNDGGPRGTLLRRYIGLA